MDRHEHGNITNNERGLDVIRCGTEIHI